MRFLKNPALTLLVKGLLALAVLGYLIYEVELSAIMAAAAEARPLWIAGAAALLPLNVWLEGAVWRRVLRPVTTRPSARALYGALLSGYALGIFTPMRAGEFAGRAFYLHHPDKWEISATVFVQRLLDMVVSVDIGLLALLYALSASLLPFSTAWQVVVAYGAGTALTLTAAMLAPALAYRLLRRYVSSQAVRRRLAFLRTLGLRQMSRALGLSALRYAVYVSQFACLLFAFSPSAPVSAVYLGTALVFFAKFLIPSLTLLDLGIREGAAVFFFGLLGVAEATAFNAAFLLFVLNLVLPAAAGLPFVFQLRFRTSDVPASTST